MKHNEFDETKREILNSFTEIFKEKFINVISTSINEDIGFEKTSETFINTNTIHSSIGNSFVYLSISFKEGFKGSLGMIITKSTVAQIADKMLMGEGDADFDEVEHLDAIQEVLNQILGASSTEFTGIFEFSISFDESKASVMDFSRFETQISPDDLVTQFSISILDKSDIFLYIPNSTFDSILAKIERSESDSGSAASNQESELEETIIGSNMLGEVSSGKDLGILMDVRLPVSVELGRKKMFIRDILKLTPGEVVELPKLQGEPVDLFVNDKKFATGEVVVIAENFGIRIKSLIKPEERLKDADAWMDEKLK